jgi:hypothetical protein
MRSGFLVQIILPLYGARGARVDNELFAAVRRELTARFGGTTAYTRAPAEGTWEDPGGRVHHDDVIVVEVMTEALDRRWWREYAAELTRRFDQESVVVRAMEYESIGGDV